MIYLQLVEKFRNLLRSGKVLWMNALRQRDSRHCILGVVLW